MKVSHLELRLSSSDLNQMLAEIAPDVKVKILDIGDSGIHGQVKLLVWNIDFIAKPSADWASDAVNLDISAHKLVNIPSSIVERQLREALKDGPPGIEVLRQSLRVHVPSLIQPLGVELRVKDIHCQPGYLVLAVEQLQLALPQNLFQSHLLTANPKSNLKTNIVDKA